MLLLILRKVLVTFLYPFFEGLDVVDVLSVLLGIDNDEFIIWQGDGLFAVFDVAYDDWQRRAEEGLEELWVEVDNREDPVEWVENTSYDLKELVEVFPVLADNHDMLLGKRIVENLDEFEEIETMDKALDVAELIRHIIALAVVHQSQTTHISL